MAGFLAVRERQLRISRRISGRPLDRFAIQRLHSREEFFRLRHRDNSASHALLHLRAAADREDHPHGTGGWPPDPWVGRRAAGFACPRGFLRRSGHNGLGEHPDPTSRATNSTCATGRSSNTSTARSRCDAHRSINRSAIARTTRRGNSTGNPRSAIHSRCHPYDPGSACTTRRNSTTGCRRTFHDTRCAYSDAGPVHTPGCSSNTGSHPSRARTTRATASQ